VNRGPNGVVTTTTTISNFNQPSGFGDQYHPAVEDIDNDGDSHMQEEWGYEEPPH